MVIANTILLKLEKKALTKSGIILPDSMVEENNIGQVIAVGSGEAEVEVGDSVVFMHKSHRVRRFVLEGEDVIRIDFSDAYLIDKKITN